MSLVSLVVVTPMVLPLGLKNKVFNFVSFFIQLNSPSWEDSKSGLRIEIGWHLIHFLAKKRSKTAKIRYFGSFRLFRPTATPFVSFPIPLRVLRSNHECTSASWGNIVEREDSERSGGLSLHPVNMEEWVLPCTNYINCIILQILSYVTITYYHKGHVSAQRHKNVTNRIILHF